MKKTFLVILLMVLCTKSIAQKRYYSELQCVENGTGTNFNHYKVAIDFYEPKSIEQTGKVTISLLEIGSALQYSISFLKKTRDQDGIIYWYNIESMGRNDNFNVVKFQKFDAPVLNGKYKYCFILSKYSNSGILIYEHSYFSK